MLKRKLWTEESMAAAVEYVKTGHPLHEGSRLYNVPVETLRRRVTGMVDISCKPGPSTVLTLEEEEQLYKYAVEMADHGFGLTRDDLMRLAFVIVDKSGRPNPFHDGMAGRGWMDGFRQCHPKITLCTPQSLSYSRAVMANQYTIDDFFGKLGGLYGRLNIISKPMQIYNADETGISVVHKPGKVISELGRKHVYCVTSGEKGRTHTIMCCVSASGVALPPLFIYPRKRGVPAVPGAIFSNSENGWMTTEIFYNWFQFFIHCIPPTRPVLLIMDGHASHVTINVIELARENNIHLLCLPAQLIPHIFSNR